PDVLAFDQPGVLIHAQVVRSHLADGLLQPFPAWLEWIAMGLAACAIFISASPAIVAAAAILAPLALLGIGLASIVGAHTLVPIASIIATFWVALLARGIFDAVEAVIVRVRLQRSFAGQVSPAVMKEILGGGL